MIGFLDLIAANAVKCANRICHFLPISIILKIGRGVGWVVFWFNTGRKRIAYSNLRAALCATKTPAELLKIVRQVYQSMSELFAEILCLTKLNKKYVDRYITVENIEYFIEAEKKGKGVILLTAHLGNWELAAIVSAIVGFPLYFLAREQSMKRLNELIDRVRESKGSKVIRKGVTTRLIVRGLHEGRIIAMAADQNGGPNGVIARFFGRLVSNVYGPYRFAAKTGAVIIPVFVERVKGPYTRVILESPIEIKDKEDLLPYIQRYNDRLQSHITKHYDQWLWFHRRWKYCPVKQIAILSDGKIRHLNQSLAIADSFKRYRLAKGIGEENTVVTVIDIRFRNKFWKTFLNINSIFSSPRCQGCLRCLKLALTAESYNKLATTYADVVISTGFSLAGINSIYTFENNAKNAVCMKQGFLGFNKFGMVVLPRHDIDKEPRHKNVIVTDTAPTLVNDSYLEKNSLALSRDLKRETKNTIGVLLGGDNSYFKYEEDDVKDVISQVLNASKIIKADLLVTTSRRTSRGIEKITKEKLSDNAQCKLLVIANEKNPPYAVGGILGLSNVIIVSGESISMVSEAVSSGKKIIVFKGRRLTNKITKYERFLDRLHKNGNIKIAKVDTISDLICDMFTKTAGTERKQESDDVYMNMWRLGG